MVIITGTSTGIGKYLAKYYLEKGKIVVGISRKHSLEHKNYSAITCDLSDYSSIKALDLSNVITNEEIILINNAGVIGDIIPTSKCDLKHFYEVAMVNIVALQYITAHVLNISNKNQVKTIVNISSGAGRRPIASWSAYCSSKAAVDMFSLTLQEELLEQNQTTKVFSLAPGVVDTKMQNTIRKSNPNDFSSHNTFVKLKEENALNSPEATAQKIDLFINAKKDVHQVINRIT